MRKTITFFFTGWLAICVTEAADEMAPPHVTVFGTATTEVVPDQMIWVLAVKNKAAVLADAARQHAGTVQQALKLLKDQGIPEAKIQTAEMEFGENREYTESSWVKKGYYASTDISFTLGDLRQYQALWMGLSQISNVSVQSVRYESSKRIEYQSETRKKAVVAARDKARALAGALDSSIAEPLLIEEDLSVNEGWHLEAANNLRTAEGNGGTSNEQLAPGRIPIQAKVRVAFKLAKHAP